MMDCIFCKIVAGEIPSAKVYEDEHVYAFMDIAPAAPVHVLVVPKEQVMSGADGASMDNAAVFGRVFTAARKIAEALGLKNGYRIVTNVGEDAGQTVPHLHFHILGGGKLGAMA
jgi:histidine triad (HIT) family protein